MFRGKKWPMNLTEKDYDYGGLYTFDGEHMNIRGSKLLMQEIASEIGSYEDVWQVLINVFNASSSTTSFKKLT